MLTVELSQTVQYRRGYGTHVRCGIIAHQAAAYSAHKGREDGREEGVGRRR